MLSREALALFRQHIERHGDIEVDDSCPARADPRRIAASTSQ